jgi:hypothetical protein
VRDAYRGTRISQAAVHCDRLVNLLRDEAKEATAASEAKRRKKDLSLTKPSGNCQDFSADERA